MSTKFTDSAFKHGCEEEDILCAWNDYVAKFIEGEDPDKIVRLGFDTHTRLLEVGANIYPDGTVRIFHAMKARPRYTQLI